MRRRLLILLAATAMCLAPGCSVLKPYTGHKFPPGTDCRPYRIIPEGLVVVCLIPVQDPTPLPRSYDGRSLDAT